jgi:hypothetical protein
MKTKKRRQQRRKTRKNIGGGLLALRRLAKELAPYGIEPSYSFTIDGKYHVELPSSWPFMNDLPIRINDIVIPFSPMDRIKNIIDDYIAKYEEKPLTLIYCHNRPISNIEEHQCFQPTTEILNHVPEGHTLVTLDIVGTPNILVKDDGFIERNKGRFAGLFILDCLMWHRRDENNPEVPLKVIKETLPLVKSGGFAIYTVLPQVFDAVQAEVGGEAIDDPTNSACYKKYLKILIP